MFFCLFFLADLYSALARFLDFPDLRATLSDDSADVLVVYVDLHLLVVATTAAVLLAEAFDQLLGHIDTTVAAGDVNWGLGTIAFLFKDLKCTEKNTIIIQLN